LWFAASLLQTGNPDPAANRRRPSPLWSTLGVVAAACIAVALAALLGTFCAGRPPVVPGSYASAWNFWRGFQMDGAFPWWSPEFSMGSSLAVEWTNLVPHSLLLAYCGPMGMTAGTHAAVFAAAFLGALGVFVFLRSYAEDVRTAWLGALLFLLFPSLLAHASDGDGFSGACVLAALPWAFAGVRSLARVGTIPSAALAALACGAVALSGGRTGFAALGFVVVFGVREILLAPSGYRPRASVLAFAIGAFALMAVVPLLPALREARFAAGPGVATLAEWQRLFSTKSALSCLDRGGWLTVGIDSAFAPGTASGGMYPGLLVLAVLGVALAGNALHSTPSGRNARFLIALALLAFWLSFGPAGVLGGHFAFLSMWLHAPDFAPALGWFSLAVLGWIVFRLVPPGWPLRKPIAGVLVFVFLVVPGFRVLAILPGFGTFRSPSDIFQLAGTACALLASAMILPSLFGKISPPALRSGVVAAALCLAALDVAVYARPVLSPLAELVSRWDDFLCVRDFLVSSPRLGRVMPICENADPLLVPALAGRSLTPTDFHVSAQPYATAILSRTAFLADDNLRSYLRIGDVAFLLIERNANVPREVEDRISDVLSRSFANEHFALYENTKTLGGAFLARDFLLTTNDGPDLATPVLLCAKYDLATVQLPKKSTAPPGLRGHISRGRIKPIDRRPLGGDSPFEPLPAEPAKAWQTDSVAPTAPGWIVRSQSWHPDWHASASGDPRPIHRAFLAFQAVWSDGSSPVEFRFSPPWWYAACSGFSLATWAACALTALGCLFPSRAWKP